jgi:branched-chain amino acid transport system ATP-binding protein
MVTNETVLELKGVRTHYGRIEALKGISLHLKKGEIVTLIGANGAGKTTTLMAISGVVKRTSGDMFYEGKSTSGMSPQALVAAGISQVPEGRRIFPRLTVLENLEMGAFTRKDKTGIRQDLEMVFSQFPILKDRRSQKGGTLSGGEQQMLAIARGLMAKPKLLLLDEPSLGLAPLLVEQIFQIIAGIQKQGVTIFLVEQNALKALKAADRGYVLENGAIVLEGKASELLQNEKVKASYLGA